MSGERTAILVADLGYGDSGKGVTIDALAEKYHAHAVVRYNGGAQAAHTVTTPDGRVHTFAQFGSATFLPEVVTYLSEYMLVDPLALVNEEAHLAQVGVHDAFAWLYIDESALMLTPFARALNRLNEIARNETRFGSCGMGVGETVRFANKNPREALQMKDMLDPLLLQAKLAGQQETMRDMLPTFAHELQNDLVVKEELAILNDLSLPERLASRYQEIVKKFQIVGEEWGNAFFKKSGVILFESAQGVLLDQQFGFAPYTTWSNTTFKNAEAILDKFDFRGERIRLGVVRAYGTRHGPGPFVTESPELTKLLPDTHNIFNEWQRTFRVGWFDAVATRYALRVVGGVDGLVITNIDRISKLTEWRFADTYDVGSDEFLRDLEFSPASNYTDQEKLSKLLFRTKPVYQRLSLDPNMQHSLTEGAHSLFDEIEKALGAPVRLVGHGPSRTQKYWRGNIF